MKHVDFVVKSIFLHSCSGQTTLMKTKDSKTNKTDAMENYTLKCSTFSCRKIMQKKINKN